MHTAGQFNADTAHSGGWIFIDAFALKETTNSTAAVLTRNAVGDYSLNRSSAGNESHIFYASPVNVRRLLEKRNLQEYFGPSASYFGPEPVGGFPPFSGTTQLTIPSTNAVSKGIKVKDIMVTYAVSTANLTSIALSLQKTVFADNAAPTVTDIPLTTTALTVGKTTDTTTPWIKKCTVNTASFLVTDLSDLTAELTIVTPNTTVLWVYGMGFHVDFNYD